MSYPLLTITRLFIFGTITAILGATFAVWPSTGSRLNLWSARDLEDEIETDLAPFNTSSQPNDMILLRIETKEHIVADLIANRTTLAEATAEFLRLNRGNTLVWNSICANYPGKTDTERSARNVIAFAFDRLKESPEQNDVRERLRCELEQILAETSP